MVRTFDSTQTQDGMSTLQGSNGEVLGGFGNHDLHQVLFREEGGGRWGGASQNPPNIMFLGLKTSFLEPGAS